MDFLLKLVNFGCVEDQEKNILDQDLYIVQLLSMYITSKYHKLLRINSMTLNQNKKKFTFLTGMIVSVLAILVFTVGNYALAQPVFTDKLDLAG